MDTQIAQKIDKHFTRYPKRKYPKGQILIFAGDDPPYIFYLTQGKVRVYDVSYRGDEVVVNMYGSPAYFPMSWAINRSNNRYFYEADTAVEMHTVPVDEALEFLRANPDAALDLLSRVFRGIDGLLERVAHLMAGSAKSRLLYELLLECRRFGEVRDDNTCLIKIHENQLASRAGLSRETVSREMKSLKADKMVTLTPKGIVVKSIKALEARLGPNL